MEDFGLVEDIHFAHIIVLLSLGGLEWLVGINIEEDDTSICHDFVLDFAILQLF